MFIVSECEAMMGVESDERKTESMFYVEFIVTRVAGA